LRWWPAASTRPGRASPRIGASSSEVGPHLTAGGLYALLEGARRALPGVEEMRVAGVWSGFQVAVAVVAGGEHEARPRLAEDRGVVVGGRAKAAPDAGLLEGARRALPGVEEMRVAGVWSGFRPTSDDDAPIGRRARRPAASRRAGSGRRPPRR
jgi:hypothetical protein